MNIVIYPPIKQVAFYIFNFPVRFYGIILSFAILIGFLFVYNFLKKEKGMIEADIFLNYFPFLVIFSVIGARLFYCLGAWKYFCSHFVEILMINHGGISIWGAVLFGALALFFFSKKYKFNFFYHGDIISMILPLCQAVGRFGNYFNQEAFGIPTQGFIKLYVQRQFRPEKYSEFEYFHPTFLYEAILDLFIFILLLFVYKKNINLNNGCLVFIYLMCYSFARIIVESLRADSILNILNIPIALIISVFVFILGIIGLIYASKKPL